MWRLLDKLEIRPKSDWQAQAEKPSKSEAPCEPVDFEEIPEEPLPPESEEGEQPEIEQEDAAEHGNERFDRALDWSRRRQQRPENLPPTTIQAAITTVLRDCPNHTCTLKSITSRVLKHIGIRTRGNPRADFEKRVMRNIGAMKRKNLVEEYQAKNRRLRLVERTFELFD